MAILSLSNQQTTKDQIKSSVDTLESGMDQRGDVWNRLPVEKKKAWIESGKDPILSQAWKTYQKLRDYFDGVD